MQAQNWHDAGHKTELGGRNWWPAFWHPCFSIFRWWLCSQVLLYI